MSSIEERLVQDIAAVTGGISMSDVELGEARTALDARIETRRRRSRSGYAAAAAAVVLIAGAVTVYQVGNDDPAAVGPAGPGQGIPELDPGTQAYLEGGQATAEVLAGVWRVDNGTVAVRFREDGTVTYDDDGSLFAEPDVTGTWTSDGDLIRISTTASDRAECIGTAVRLWASNPDVGRVRTVLVDGDRAECSPVDIGHQTLEKLFPTVPSLGNFAREFAAESGWRPLVAGSILDGFYFGAENHLLELTVDRTGADGQAAVGRYHVGGGSDSIVDQGTWRSEQGLLVLTSSAESVQCQEGDRLFATNVEYLSGGTLAFRAEITRNDCGGAWATRTWVRVPDATNSNN